jgi:hypothetical protein
VGTRRREDGENSDRDWMESARADTTQQEERERARRKRERELKRGFCVSTVSALPWYQDWIGGY